MARTKKLHPADARNAAIAARAVRFEVAHFLGVGRYAHHSAATYDDAKREATRIAAEHPNGRVPMIYAFDASGRAATVADDSAIPEQENEVKTYAKKFNALRAAKQSGYDRSAVRIVKTTGGFTWSPREAAEQGAQARAEARTAEPVAETAPEVAEPAAPVAEAPAEPVADAGAHLAADPSRLPEPAAEAAADEAKKATILANIYRTKREAIAAARRIGLADRKVRVGRDASGFRWRVIEIVPAWTTEHPAEYRASDLPQRKRGKRAEIDAAAREGALPAPPDFSAATHTRFRAKLAKIVALVAAGDINGLKAFPINPVSSSPKAMARYRDLCVVALEAR